eukprot:NODE_5330_length_1029_cov_40.803532_g4762_i0.p1 GENE.NODE_5330_length_1029_cov_40.803532_g4762_i0~~NODE_5330_length_1029_cov_40.803532_g4762_i0.p1  ORF type:complete len:302 (-),score=66.39 NODE_5330_length_1029_cov_40.803532_g4762_i0:124-981(-)
MAPSGGNLVDGAVLQCIEAASLGMPFEVWKTRLGRYRTETTIQALKNVYNSAGGGFKGVAAFWNGLSAKLVESATKGAVLLYSKETILHTMLNLGLHPSLAGAIAGAGGGVCQTSVMGPCTLLVTAVVTQKGSDKSVIGYMSTIWKTQGIKGFYPGGSAIAWRQATNWASRQGFTEYLRKLALTRNHSNESKPKLSIKEELLCGIVGGALATWNTPFEVARIEMQARAVFAEKKLGLMGTLGHIYQEAGVPGLFKGIAPRICLGVWQTVFMVTVPKLLANWRQKH